MASKRTRREFSDEEMAAWLRWKRTKLSELGGKCNLSNLLNDIPNAPSLRSIRRWEWQSEHPDKVVQQPSKRGSQPKLSKGEQHVVAGWVLKRLRQDKLTQRVHVMNFVKKAFGETVSEAWVSVTLRSMGFSSQRAISNEGKKPVHADLEAMADFIKLVRSHVNGLNDLSRLVAMDETAFWNSGVVLRSYAVRNGGQPRVLEARRTTKDLCVVALCANGSCLPPVVFTTDKRLETQEFEDDCIIAVVEQCSGPSIDLMKRWVDLIKDYVNDRPILLWDQHSSHHNDQVKEALESLGVTVIAIPASCGKLLNPVDNHWNAAFKATYYKQPRSTHQEMVRAIHVAFRSQTEENIKNYFNSIGYTTNDNPRRVAQRLLGQGYGKGAISEANERAYTQTFERWRHTRRQLLDNGIRPKEPPVSLGVTELDGVYWNVWQ